MPIYIKQNKKYWWEKHRCRKDWRKRHLSLPRGTIKKWRKVANQEVRNYKGETSNGGWYKKVFDLWWTVY